MKIKNLTDLLLLKIQKINLLKLNFFISQILMSLLELHKDKIFLIQKIFQNLIINLIYFVQMA